MTEHPNVVENHTCPTTDAALFNRAAVSVLNRRNDVALGERGVLSLRLAVSPPKETEDRDDKQSDDENPVHTHLILYLAEPILSNANVRRSGSNNSLRASRLCLKIRP